jgi:hypothetical protein
MLKIEEFVTPSPEQWKFVIKGMRNAKNSWDRMDSEIKLESPHDVSGGYFEFGPNDHGLAMDLSEGGGPHAKFRRMLPVWVTINAPLYLWKEFDTYKVGTVCNSCSTMHKIHAKEFELSDFSTEHLIDCHDIIEDEELKENLDILEKYQFGSRILASLSLGEHDFLTVEDSERKEYLSPVDIFEMYIIGALNLYRNKFLETKDKKYWWQMIQLLPSSYNQKRTICLNYQVLHEMYKWRKNHKLDEWRTFCKWIEELPYSELITLYEEEEEQ